MFKNNNKNIAIINYDILWLVRGACNFHSVQAARILIPNNSSLPSEVLLGQSGKLRWLETA